MEVYTDKDFIFEEVPMPRRTVEQMIPLIEKNAPAVWSDAHIRHNAEVLAQEDAESKCYLSPMFQVVRRVLWDEQHGFEGNTPTYLSFKRIDREPLGDWRAKQRIKNAVLGDHWEGVELYPAEERLVDTSNQYHMFAWEGIFPIYLFNSREVYSKEYAEELNKELGMKTKQR
jgi:hypothetical protein|tara:strand:+ start:513 stop:1028 length:516 start_codon:yes stop_codon:yes gene_type:complete